MAFKWVKYIFFIFIFFGISQLTASCKAKEGCALEEKYAPNMKSKGGKTTLYSKKQTKKMKKKG
jgi:hypothetical protein